MIYPFLSHVFKNVFLDEEFSEKKDYNVHWSKCLH